MPAVNCYSPRGVSCSVHGPERVAWDSVAPGTLAYRCTVETGDGTRCGPITLPPPPRLPWRVRVYDMLPERATVECIMCTLVIGFWISALFWVPFLFDRYLGP